jgi:thioester reductase-like protein
MNETVLLTGITGNLGSWLAVEMLKRGTKVLALMRDVNSKDVNRRLDRVLGEAGYFMKS